MKTKIYASFSEFWARTDKKENGVSRTPVMRFGKLTDEGISDYHASLAVSKSKLDTFRDSPVRFQMRYLLKTLPDEKTDALIMGSAVDVLALEGPDAFGKRFVVVPDDAPKKPTKPQINAIKKSPAALASMTFWNSFHEANRGKEILDADDMETAKRCAAALHANKEFAQCMDPAAGGESQVTFRIQGDRFALQCRPDRWLEQGCALTDGMPCIVDVKTIAELPCDQPDHLSRHICDYGYHRAAYLYPEIVAQVMKDAATTDAQREFWETYRPPFIFAFVEKREPFAVVTCKVSDDAIDIGRMECAESFDRLRRCLRDNHWPETWDAPIAEVSLPNYYTRRVKESAGDNLFG